MHSCVWNSLCMGRPKMLVPFKTSLENIPSAKQSITTHCSNHSKYSVCTIAGGSFLLTTSVAEHILVVVSASVIVYCSPKWDCLWTWQFDSMSEHSTIPHQAGPITLCLKKQQRLWWSVLGLSWTLADEEGTVGVVILLYFLPRGVRWLESPQTS